MIRYMYSYFNTIGSFFMPPWPIESKPEELADLLKMQFATMNKAQLASLSEDDIYYIGSFDTNTGVMCVNDKPQFVAHCSTLARYYYNSKEELEGEEDGRKEECKKD